MPPSLTSIVRNASVLAADWRAAGAVARLYMASQVLSLVMMVACTAGAVFAAITGQLWPYLGLLAAAAICFFQTLGAWTVLKQRYGVRYELL